VAGHHGQPVAVPPQGREGRRQRLRGARGRGPFAPETPPLCGMMQRCGRVGIPRRDTGHPPTLDPVINHPVVPGSLVATDADTIDGRLWAWGDAPTRVHHGVGEDARDEDGDGCCEVPVQTMAGVWSWWRRWLRPPRGIAPAKLPRSRGRFACVHQISKRGKALRHSLIE
jgi:hypothetical protein